ncbi:MAG: LON peptidase substrate-binding domain-containing protein, partial [Bacteroidota bacterium]|nr:LON peptidase substrate-binding domain-containing protein [Bacteroidota bacterium]
MTKDKDKDTDISNEQAAPPPPAVDEKRVVLAREMLPATLPIIPIGNRPVFPRMVVPVALEDQKAVKVIEELADKTPKFVGVILKRGKTD